jgi:hypothetical protein
MKVAATRIRIPAAPTRRRRRSPDLVNATRRVVFPPPVMALPNAISRRPGPRQVIVMSPGPGAGTGVAQPWSRMTRAIDWFVQE